ncbi:dimethyladenosine transferase 2, mitochondrial [Leptopilina boulardi]|uniref:dimethyladenosine transferase 2, mitochondrial n=1 Tax=Leptopilina boulardi TaxID=63433 RepID=UPI0021F68048|nr:dimethyladenosine transferase 2, mitochondrial [Leptopilina boulardi]
MILQNSIMLKLIRDQFSTTIKNSIRCCAAIIKKNEENKIPENMDVNNNSENEKPKKTTYKKKEGITKTEIKKYLKSVNSEELINNMPNPMNRRSRNPAALFLIDSNLAEKIANKLEDALTSDPDMFIAEVNPGWGLLTENLLKKSISKIHLYETFEFFLNPNSRLQNIVKKNEERLELRKKNLFDLWTIVFRDFRGSTNDEEKLLKGTKIREWKDKPYMTVIGTITNESFIKHLIMSVLFQNTFMKRGRIVFYLMIDPIIWEKYISPKQTGTYNCRSVIFQSLFDYEKIETLPRKSFLPWLYKKTYLNQTNNKNLRKLKYEYVYFVRIEPKIDLYDNISQADLLTYYYFIKYHMQISHTRVIPALENWIPGCGPRLIMRNFTIYTEFQDLDVKQLLDLYKEFSSWPEFKECYFLTLSSDFYSSMEDAFHEMGCI